MSKRTISMLLVLVCIATVAVWATTRFDRLPRNLAEFRNSVFATGSKADGQAGPGPRHLETSFLGLEIETIAIPGDSKGSGGGLTSFGDELVLLDPRGKVFVISDGQVTETTIETPDNGYQAYAALAAEKKGGRVKFNPALVRYNDILHVKAAARSHLVLSYTEWFDEARCYGTTVAALELPAGVSSLLQTNAVAAAWQIVYQSRPCLALRERGIALNGHLAGGRIADYGDGTIIVGNGDYGFDGLTGTRAYSQLEDNDYGKILKIDLKLGSTTSLSIGNRNTQGVLVDSHRRIWVVEHGMRGGDELNLITEGRNYGWPLNSLGTSYQKQILKTATNPGRHLEFERPVFAWLPSVATSGLAEIQGFHAAWNGDFLVGGLSSESVFRVREADGRVLFVEPVPLGERIRYVHQHTSGEIALWTDRRTVVLLRPTKLKTQAYNATIKRLQALQIAPQLADRVVAELDSCLECHALESGVDLQAPSLHRLRDRKPGQSGFKAYSEALLKRDAVVWDEPALTAFLADPAGFAPGTSMPNPQIADAAVLGALVRLLLAQGAPIDGE